MKRRILSMALISAIAAAPVLSSAATMAQAAPLAAGSAIAAGTDTQAQFNDGKAKLEKAHWRGGYRHRHGRRYHRHHRDRDAGDVVGSIASGIAGAIALGIISNSQRDRISRRQSDWERCDRRYRSFRWSDGTFQPYGNKPRKLCPYLY